MERRVLQGSYPLYETNRPQRATPRFGAGTRPAWVQPTWAEWALSPHHNSRAGAPVRAIIYHFTAGPSLEGTVRGFQQRSNRRSAHYVIGRDGRLVQMVPLDRAAWHAGRSSLAGRGNVNRFSIGIEIVNWGQLIPRGGRYCAQRSDSRCTHWERCRHQFCTWPGRAYTGPSPIFARGQYWEPFTDAQYRTLIRLTQHLLARFPTITHITGHEDVALPRGRKNDPGGAFDWRRIRAALRPRFHGHIGPLSTARQPETEFEQLLMQIDQAIMSPPQQAR